MKQLMLLISVFATSSFADPTPEAIAKQFLAYVYGGSDISINQICETNDNLWMLRGARNTDVVRAIESQKFSIKDPGVYAGVIGRSLCIVEIQRGKVVPTFNLDMIYKTHRQIIDRFLYEALLQDREKIARLVTNPDNVSFGISKPAASGDMDVYAGVIGNLPVIRVSAPVSDKASKSVSYRLPLGEDGFELHLIKEAGFWKIDTHKKLVVPLEFFYQ